MGPLPPARGRIFDGPNRLRRNGSLAHCSENVLDCLTRSHAPLDYVRNAFSLAPRIFKPPQRVTVNYNRRQLHGTASVIRFHLLAPA
jgi:hypothetical protein